jgi:uncharacterized protein (DUF2062 family)
VSASENKNLAWSEAMKSRWPEQGNARRDHGALLRGVMALAIAAALAIGAGCAFLALIGSLILSQGLAAIILAYMVLMVLYSAGSSM